jgi:simple sugar transport system substrate-binding protein
VRAWALLVAGAVVIAAGLVGGAWWRHHDQPLIVVLSGGDPGRNAFAGFIAAGARQAATECAVRVEVIGTDWNLQDQLVELRAAFDRHPTGICLPGHAGEDALSSLVNQAIDQCIVVTGFNVDMPHLRERHRQKGFGFIGADPVTSGKTMAAAAVKRLDLHGGERVLLLGTQIGRGSARVERMRTVAADFRATGQEVIEVALPAELEGLRAVSAREAAAFLDTVLVGRTPIRLIVVDAPQTALAMVPALPALRRGGKMDLVTFDLTPEIGAAIAVGDIAFAIDQQPWLQGYLSVMQVVLTRRAGVAGMHIDTGAQVVGSLEYAGLEALIARGIR